MSANPENIFETIEFTLNGASVEALPGETIIQAARRTGTEIPHLCYTEGLRADGNCRACVVEIDGVTDAVAREALRLAAMKLPVKTRTVHREDW